MKRTLLTLLLPTVALLFLLNACKKNDDGEHNTVTPSDGYTTLDQALASAAPLAKTFSISVPSGDTFFTVGGARIGIPINAFETLTGGKVTGSVQVTFNNWLQKGDMIFGKVLPLSYGVPLVSGGQVFVSVTQNGQPVRLKKGSYIHVWLPQFGVSPLIDTFGYVGRDIIGTSNTVNWLQVDTNVILIDRTSIADTLLLRCDTLGYLAAGVPLSFGNQYDNFTVKVQSPVTLENSMAVISYDDTRALYPLTALENGQISAMKVPHKKLRIVVMGVKSGVFYGGILPVSTPSSDSTYTDTLKAITPATLKLQLNALL